MAVLENTNRSDYAQRMVQAVEFIHQHLDEELTLAQICRVACFSPFHFHRQFSAYLGVPVMRFIHLLRMKRSALDLAFNKPGSVLDVALACGYESQAAFSRAFKALYGQTPAQFRTLPVWNQWHEIHRMTFPKEYYQMQVELLDFPETMVAALEHRGPESQVYASSMKFIDWRRESGIRPDHGNTYGIHYSDPKTTLPEDYRMDICVSVDEPVNENSQGVITKVIPGGRCAVVRHTGSREYIPAAEYLYREWLPQSGEELRDFPIFFHYVNVGPGVKDHEMITDVYLPLR